MKADYDIHRLLNLFGITPEHIDALPPELLDELREALGAELECATCEQE